MRNVMKHFLSFVLIILAFSFYACSEKSIITYTITISHEITHGTVTVYKTNVMGGEQITITANPDNGYILRTIYVMGETGSLIPISGSGNIRIFIMPSQNVTIYASFDEAEYGVYVMGEISNGRVTTDKTNATVGDTVSILASPENGYYLQTISVIGADNSVVRVSGNGNARTFVMPAQDVTVNATFTVAEYSINVASEITNGNVTVSASSACLGQTVSVVAIPDQGYSLSEVIVTCVDGTVVTVSYSGNTSFFTMPNGDVNVTAIFTNSPTYRITISNVIANGSVTANKVNALEGEQICLTVSSDDGYTLSSITVTREDGVIVSVSESTNSFSMPAQDVTVNATFTAVEYSINVASEITNGSISLNRATAKIGDTVSIIITPSAGYELSSITVTGVDNVSVTLKGSNNTRTFIMPAQDVTVNATFTAVEYGINVVSEITNGSISLNRATAKIGDTVSIIITPSAGYELSSITVTGADNTLVTINGSNNTRTFIMPAQNVTVSASFCAHEYYIHIDYYITNGNVTTDKTKAIVGESVTLTAIPNSSCFLSSITVTGSNDNVIIPLVGNDSTRVFSMPTQNVYITAFFEREYIEYTPGISAPYLLFGAWPQTKLSDNSITVDETDSKVVGIFTYYRGSDNAWYAKINSSYYKVEPIKWCVLTTNYDHDGIDSTAGKKLLLAESILINCKYYDDYNDIRTIENKKIYPNNYEHSRVRAYLNGLSYQIGNVPNTSFVQKGFLQTAFTNEEQNQILTTKVINNERSSNPEADSTWYNNGSNRYVSGIPTDDKIFLLSVQESSNDTYGFSVDTDSLGFGNTRIRKSTDFAKDSGTYSSDTPQFGSCWWLRSPWYNNKEEEKCVLVNGSIQGFNVIESAEGLLPALCVE